MSARTYGRGTSIMLNLLTAAVIVTLFFACQTRSREDRVADGLAAAPLVMVADFPAQGTARIQGQIELVGPGLAAPVSGERCAYYELDLTGGRKVGRRRRARGQAFLVADASGTALVRLGDTVIVENTAAVAAMISLDKAHCRQGTLAELEVQKVWYVLGLFEEIARADSELAKIRYRECVLPGGARVAVAGAGTVQPGQAPGQAARLTLAATLFEPLYIAVTAGP
jgi:hypothetical protein